MLAGADAETWPAELRQALQHPRHGDASCNASCRPARAHGMDALDLERLGGAGRPRRLGGRRPVLRRVHRRSPRCRTRSTTPTWCSRPSVLLDDPDVPRRDGATGSRSSSSTNTRTPTRCRSSCSRRSPATDETSSWSAIPISRSTGSAAPTSAASSTSPTGSATRRGPAPRSSCSRHTNRYGPTIGAAVRSIVDNRGALGAVDGAAVRSAAFTRLAHARRPGAVDGADLLVADGRGRAHRAAAARGPPPRRGDWHDMAVLVRSGSHLGRLQRALTTAGVPVEVAGDEVPLAVEPSVRALLSALHAADDLQAGRDARARRRPRHCSPGRWAGSTPRSLRRLGRALRRPRHDGEHPRPSRILVAEALADPALLADLGRPGSPEGDAVAAAARLAKLLRKAADQISRWRAGRAGALDDLWRRHRLAGPARRPRPSRRRRGRGPGRPRPRRHVRTVRRGGARRGAAGAPVGRRGRRARSRPSRSRPTRSRSRAPAPGRAAHDGAPLQGARVAARGRRGCAGRRVARRPMAQQPAAARPALARRRAATARRRARRSPRSAGCSTSPAAAPGRDSSSRPWPVAATTVTSRRGSSASCTPTRWARRVASLPGRAAVHAVHSRCAARSPSCAASARGPTTGRTRAGRRAAGPARRAPASAVGRPRPVVGSARDHRHRRTAARSRRAACACRAARCPRSPSCPLKWFLSHEAKGGRGTTAAQGFGSIVHAIAAEVVPRGLEPDPDRARRASRRGVGPARVRARGSAPASTLLPWRRSSGSAAGTSSTGARSLAAEHRFKVTTDVDGRTVMLNGSMDRVEVDVTTASTSSTSRPPRRTMPTGPEIASNPQLGFYQLAVELGATDGRRPRCAGRGRRAGTAPQRHQGRPGYPKVQPQARSIARRAVLRGRAAPPIRACGRCRGVPGDEVARRVPVLRVQARVPGLRRGRRRSSRSAR